VKELSVHDRSASHDLTLFSVGFTPSDPLIENQLVVRLNFGEEDTHPGVLPSMNHLTQGIEVLSSVGNLYSDLCPGREGFQCVHTASEQAEVGCLFLSLSFRLQIGKFDAGTDGITSCSVALKRHLKLPPGSFAQAPNSIALLDKKSPKNESDPVSLKE
jgi:hypothetical protein